MDTGRKLTEREKELFEENEFLKGQLERERKSNTILLDLMTYNDLLMKAQKYDKQKNHKSVDFSFLESRFNEGGK